VNESHLNVVRRVSGHRGETVTTTRKTDPVDEMTMKLRTVRLTGQGLPRGKRADTRRRTGQMNTQEGSMIDRQELSVVKDGMRTGTAFGLTGRSIGVPREPLSRNDETHPETSPGNGARKRQMVM
jgi:hypothetical protein